jgi:hypothetical protein
MLIDKATWAILRTCTSKQAPLLRYEHATARVLRVSDYLYVVLRTVDGISITGERRTSKQYSIRKRMIHNECATSTGNTEESNCTSTGSGSVQVAYRLTDTTRAQLTKAIHK